MVIFARSFDVPISFLENLGLINNSILDRENELE